MENEVKNDPLQLARDIRNSWEYRANPTNCYHKRYQAALNRQFGTLMFLALFTVLVLEFGILDAFTILAAAVVGGGWAWLLVQILPEIWESSISWLNGRS